MEVETLAKQVEQLQGRIQVLEDENAIQKLETAYAYFLEHLMVDEITDCWVDGGALVWVGLGVFRDKPAIKKVWETVKEHFAEKGETRHMGPRISPYVTIAPDGKTANARWYVAGTPLGAGMLCENTYVKDDGVWKIDVMEVGAFPLDPSTLAVHAASAMSALGADAATAAMNEADRPPMTPEEEEKHDAGVYERVPVQRANSPHSAARVRSLSAALQLQAPGHRQGPERDRGRS